MRLFLIFLLAFSISFSQNLCKKISPKSFKCGDTLLNGYLIGDINGDSKKEIVGWRVFAKKEIGEFCQLLILNHKGKTIWKGAKVENIDNAYIFGEWDIGVSLPEVLVDIDMDKSAELLAPAPQGDVSPVYYRIFKWIDGNLEPQKPMMLLQSKSDKALFIWQNRYPKSLKGLIWVAQMKQNTKNSVKATIMFYKDSGDMGVDEVVLEFKKGGAKVVR